MPDGFEWNPEKAARNLNYHGVSFEEAATVFDDGGVVIEPDYAHSDFEERFYAIGISERARILFVVFTERGDAARIISAREATTREQKHYETNQIY
jgi:uncharacterized DUF497 family protein